MDYKFYFKDIHQESSVGCVKYYYRVDENGNVQEITYNIMNGSYGITEDFHIDTPFVKARIESAEPSTSKVFEKKKKAAYNYSFNQATRA